MEYKKNETHHKKNTSVYFFELFFRFTTKKRNDETKEYFIFGKKVRPKYICSIFLDFIKRNIQYLWSENTMIQKKHLPFLVGIKKRNMWSGNIY